MKTQGLHSFAFGRMEASIAIPGGKGIWPAFWMLGANFPIVGWPDCGEVDILEHVETSDMPLYTVRGSLHGPNYSGANSLHGDVKLSSGLTNVFHTYAAEWSPTEIRFYFDNTNYYTGTSNSMPSKGTWAFDHPFFFIMNLAVGGSWPGSPDATTHFPARMLVDYVRVYRDSTSPAPSNGLKASIAMSPAANGPNWQAIGTVTVTDINGNRVSGVNVEGLWSGIVNVGTLQKVTDANGVAVLSSGRVKQSGTIQLCLADLDKAGYVYAPSVTDCASITR
jgi:beta-glucanase (GH16 family)